MPVEIPFLYENVFGKSAEVSVKVAPITVAYALTLIVKDAITKKPVVGATVTVNTNSTSTDETGKAVFETIPPGTYTVEIRHPSYLTKKLSVTLTEAGLTKEVTLIPLWSIGVGIVGGVSILTIIIAKAVK
jgi:uncharacterized membrane protein